MTPLTLGSRLRRKLSSYYTFVVRESFGYHRPMELCHVTDEDLAKHEAAERELRGIRLTLRYLDVQTDVYRRPDQ